MESFEKQIERLSIKHGGSAMFGFFLDIVMCTLANQTMEERYLKIINQFSKDEINQIASAFAALINEMDNDGEGLKDVLGAYFEENISHGRNGQFFTPEYVCQFMAQITMTDIESRQTVMDPACGSGRTLMAAAKLKRNLSFYGADNDQICAKMTLINFCLNGMLGEVSWMDSLSLKMYGAWKITQTLQCPAPHIIEIPLEESIFYAKLVMDPKPAVQPKVIVSPITTTKPVQLTFDF